MKTNNKMENEKEIPSAEVSMIERRNPTLYRSRRPFEMSYWEMSLIERALGDSIKLSKERLSSFNDDDLETCLIVTESILFREALLKRIKELNTNEFLMPLPF